MSEIFTYDFWFFVFGLIVMGLVMAKARTMRVALRLGWFIGGIIVAISAMIYAAGWDGSGNFTRAHDWTDDRDAGIKIQASRMDTEDDNFASGINAAITQNNENKPTADFAPNADATYDLGTAALRWVDVMLSNAVKFVDATGDVGSIVITTLSADRTYTLPDASGTLLAGVVSDTTPQLGGDLDLNGNNIDFPTTANISDVLDEDNMASDSATVLATQQSIKAYVDTEVAGSTAITGANFLAPHESLVIDGITNTTVDIDADAIMLRDSSDVLLRSASVNLTVDTAAGSAKNGFGSGLSESSSTWYYLCVGDDGGTAYGWFDTSVSCANDPDATSSYAGLVGAVYNNSSSNFVAFRQVGNHARLDTLVRDVNNTADHTTAQTPTLSVPPSTLALITAAISQSSGTAYELITATTETNSVPSSSLFTIAFDNSPAFGGSTFLQVPADGSSQIRYRSSDAGMDIQIFTLGWIWQ